MEIPVNTGIAFEVLVRQIFQKIVDADAERTIQVRQNVTLQGKHAKHQIDVYWEFEHPKGIVYRTVVQVKDWNKPIYQGELLKFKGVLDDLPGQPKGVVVTRSGYQQGAADYAKAHGILLFELSEWRSASQPRLSLTTLGSARMEVMGNWDPEKREVLSLVLKTTSFEPKITNQKIQSDSAWLGNLSADVAAVLNGFIINYRLPTEVSFYDEKGNIVTTLDQIYRGAIKDMEKSQSVFRELSNSFEEPTFVSTGIASIPRMKVTKPSADITIEAGEPRYVPFEVPNIANFVFRNLTDGSTHLIQRKK